jgi:hypothetical protein
MDWGEACKVGMGEYGLGAGLNDSAGRLDWAGLSRSIGLGRFRMDRMDWGEGSRSYWFSRSIDWAGQYGSYWGWGQVLRSVGRYGLGAGRYGSVWVGLDRLDLGKVKVGKGSGQDLQGSRSVSLAPRPQALGTLGVMGPGFLPKVFHQKLFIKFSKVDFATLWHLFSLKALKNLPYLPSQANFMYLSFTC